MTTCPHVCHDGLEAEVLTLRAKVEELTKALGAKAVVTDCNPMLIKAIHAFEESEKEYESTIADLTKLAEDAEHAWGRVQTDLDEVRASYLKSNKDRRELTEKLQESEAQAGAMRTVLKSIENVTTREETFCPVCNEYPQYREGKWYIVHAGYCELDAALSTSAGKSMLSEQAADKAALQECLIAMADAAAQLRDDHWVTLPSRLYSIIDRIDRHSAKRDHDAEGK